MSTLLRRLLSPLALILALGVLAACDSAPADESTPDPTPTAPLRVYSETAWPGNLGLGIALTSDGAARAPGSLNIEYHQVGTPFHSFLSGLWLGTDAGGAPAVSAVRTGSSRYSNVAAECATGGGLFSLDADTLYTQTEAWPRALGAPTAADGSPLVYGDRMLWGAFCPSAGEVTPELGAPVRDVRVAVAVFAYDRADLEDVRFVRHEITNAGTAPIADLYAGYFTDTDLTLSRDAVAFDEAQGFSYDYSLHTDTDGAFVNPAISGFAFLETPADVPLFTHRIMRKSIYPDYGEVGVDRPEQLLWALQGLTNDGAPMVDPTTGAEARFAFTGDPFTATGWVDGRDENGEFQGIDVRQLTSVAPVTLAPGETVVATVVWISPRRDSPQASRDAALQTLAAVRAEPSLWRFPVAVR